jgi:hypothetical protein
MYNEKLVVAIKHNGKILREFKDIVYLPFGSEYTILLKNLSTVRAQVKVFIDGTDATENVSLVVYPKASIELERFITNGNTERGNKFKFIERTESIEEYRGIGEEDGIIRVEYQFEKVYLNLQDRPMYQPIWHQPTYPSILRGAQDIYGQPGTPKVGDITFGSTSSISSCSASVNTAGITVPGSISKQEFTYSSFFAVDLQQHNIVLRLMGEVEKQPVVEPVTVKTQNKCNTCGKVSKAAYRFCSRCGTSLTII